MHTRRLRLLTHLALSLFIVLACFATPTAQAAKRDQGNARKSAFPVAQQEAYPRPDTGLGRNGMAAGGGDCDDDEDMEAQAAPPPAMRRPHQARAYGGAEPMPRMAGGSQGSAEWRTGEWRPAAPPSYPGYPPQYAYQQPAYPGYPAYNEPARPTWELAPTDKTLKTALARWSRTAGWQLVWELPVDYEVDARTAVQGTFQEAVGAVARSMESAEVPMKAIFYAGNRVLRVVAKGAE